ncbi:hypothetical protein BU26DRAFT_500127 [Trematosphaeria pertusa]|uniref:Zn(2)-C6 fungal-type domain-containing protein n=1 Tax=Trematosphaeria pertusa TaxID=390896 RepID=A0A6A6IYU4_9PLEO|nr:uncharacterized protein BU26DRAFT_500127 [Trematosphaeria pertusa]KAF2254353.1 hypothetical protein BU26DRAFT_500127 [Trematosphaeria pertusa]
MDTLLVPKLPAHKRFSPKAKDPNVCDSCRAGKRRCSGERPVCDRCQSSGRACVYPGGTANTRATRASTVSSEDAFDPPLPRGSRGVRHELGQELDRKLKVQKEVEDTRVREGIEERDGDGDGDGDVDMDMDMREEPKAETEAEQNTIAVAAAAPKRRGRPRKKAPATATIAVRSKPSGNTAPPDPPSNEPSASALLALRSSAPAPRYIHFNDLDLTALPADLAAEWSAIKRKVFAAVNFVEGGEVLWDTTGVKERELQQLILEVRGLQEERKAAVQELGLGLERLAEMLLQVHDFYECLRTCLMSLGALGEVVDA